MMKDRLVALAAGVASAMLLLLALTGLPIAMLFLYTVPLPLYLIGLRQGLSGLILAGAIGTVVAGMVSGTIVAALGFLLLFAAPALTLVHHALLSRTGGDGRKEWYPPGWLAGWLAAMAAMSLIVLDIALMGDGGGDGGGLEGHISRTLPEALERLTGGNTPPDLLQRTELWIGVFPAMLACAWIGAGALNAGVAQNVLQKGAKALRPTPEYTLIEAPFWVLYALAAAAFLALVGPGTLDYLGRNLAIIFAMPYFFVGLATVHVLARRAKARLGVLVTFYILLIFLGLVGMFAVSALGLAEQFLRLRRKWPSTRGA